MSDLTSDLLAALVVATPQRKRDALRMLRGDPEPERTPVPSPCVEPYLTLQEVGRRLEVSSCSLWRWGVPGHQLGGRRRFRVSEVEAYLASEEFKKRAEDLKKDRRYAREEVKAAGRRSDEEG
jgi:hypothetical protein